MQSRDEANIWNGEVGFSRGWVHDKDGVKMKQLSSEKRVMKALCQARVFGHVYFTRALEDVEQDVRTLNGYVPGWVLSERNVGGSEGLRRLRDLRQKGYKISKVDVKDSTAKYKLMLPYPDVFDMLDSLTNTGEYPPKFARDRQNSGEAEHHAGSGRSSNTGGILTQQKLF